MTTRQADRLIRSGKPTTVRSQDFNETFAKIFVSRDRYNITSQDGGLYDRADLQLIEAKPD